MSEYLRKYCEQNFSDVLIYFLKNQFNVDVVTDYEEIKRIKTDPTFFPNCDRAKFKQNLAEVIIDKKLTPTIYESLTDYELETQKEVNEVLVNEIWKPIYGDEPIKI